MPNGIAHRDLACILGLYRGMVLVGGTIQIGVDPARLLVEEYDMAVNANNYGKDDE